MADQQILVLGSTGTIGRRVVQQLSPSDARILPASRSGSIRHDWNEPATWNGALFGGTDAMFVMAPDGVGIDPRFLTEAHQSGVTRFVLLSSKAIDVMQDERLLAAEQAIKASGAEWTIVRPDWFNQNFSEGFLREAVAAGEVTIPLGEMRQAFNDARDIAAVVAAALTEDGHHGQTYELSGPDAITFGEAAGMVSKAVGKPIYYDGSADAYIRTMTGFGLDRADVLRDVEAFEALQARGDSVPNDTVKRITGKPPRTFADFVEAAATEGVWSES
ncbi:Rossmann-fold NAD(P)-binding domain-containing protein [Arthrobacter pigmenti]